MIDIKGPKRENLSTKDKDIDVHYFQGFYWDGPITELATRVVFINKTLYDVTCTTIREQNRFRPRLPCRALPFRTLSCCKFRITGRIFFFFVFFFGKKNLHDISPLPDTNGCYDATMFRSVPIWHCLKFHYFKTNKIPFEMFWNVLKVLRVTRFFFFFQRRKRFLTILFLE